MRYFVTDTLCFPAEFPASLVRRQEESWSPIIRWAESHYGVRIGIATGLSDPSHPPETLSTIRKSLDSWSQWQLVALDEAVRSSKSLLVALALLHGAVSLEHAANAARTEVLHQIERWGEVEDTHDVDYHDMRVRLGSALFLHQCVRQPPLFS